MVANSWLVIFQVNQQNSMMSRTQTGFLLSTWDISVKLAVWSGLNVQRNGQNASCSKSQR